MSEIKVDNLTGKTTAKDITVTVGATATQSLEQGLTKAWVNFTGITTTASRDSLNVSSLTDLGTGQTTVTYTNVMNDANYTGSLYQNGNPGSAINNFSNDYAGGFGNRTASSYGIYAYSGTAVDAYHNDSTIFGDLA